MKIPINSLTNNETENPPSVANDISKHTQEMHDAGTWNSDEGYRTTSRVVAIKGSGNVVLCGEQLNALLTLGQDWIHEDDIEYIDSYHFIHPSLATLSIPVDELNLDPKNARKHGEENMRAVRNSLRRFGQRQPVVVQKDGMVVRAGNARLTAARELGWTHIAALVCDEPEANAAAYALMDNRSAELATWDDDALASTMLEISHDDATLLDYVGFEEQEIQSFLDTQYEEDDPPEESALPELPKDPVTKPGDIWTIAGHRIMCGDCRNQDHVDRLMSGTKANVVITSPPYASQRKYDEASEFKPIHPDAFVDWFANVQECTGKILSDDGSFFVNIKEHCEDGQRVLYVKDLTLAFVREWGWRFVDEFCWVHGGTPRRVDVRFRNGWEPIFQFTKSNHKFRPDNVTHHSDSIPNWGGVHKCAEDVQGTGWEVKSIEEGEAYPSNALKMGKNREAIGHSAAFPITLPEFFIKAFSDEGDAVYDPFCGSGTTIVAAHKNNRVGYGMEVSPAYCDLIIRRLEELTGEDAERR